MNRPMITILLVAILFAAPACSAPEQTEAAEPIAETTEQVSSDTMAPAAEEPEIEEDQPMETAENLVAEMETGQGAIVLRFFPEKAPNHVRNFIELSRSGFYEGTKFHRVIPGFMIQGGDPNTKSGAPSTWGTGGSGKNVDAEFSDISHKRGIVSMARSQNPNSASSQFFIVTTDSTFLDRQYSAFGEVISGMEVADNIVNAPRGAQDRPENPVAIERITIREARPDEL